MTGVSYATWFPRPLIAVSPLACSGIGGALHLKSYARPWFDRLTTNGRFKLTVRPELVEGQCAQSDTSCARLVVGDEGRSFTINGIEN